jgi:hypothetical protein
MSFQRSGEVGGGAKGFVLISATAAVLYNVQPYYSSTQPLITQPPTQHTYSVGTLTVTLQSTGHLRCQAQGYPKGHQLLVSAYYQTRGGGEADARTAYAAGIKAVPKSITLRVLARRLEEADGKSIRARALPEKACLVNPKSDVLRAEAVKVEERSGAPTQKKALLARALREYPTSRIPWSMAIWPEARLQCKAQCGRA